MQVFVCYPEPIKVAQAIWRDKKRYNKQLIECTQILDAIDGVGKGWFNHPVVKMYKNHREWLMKYALCLQEYRNYERYYHTDIRSRSISKQNAIKYSFEADQIRPPFLTEEFCIQHRKRLYTKAPELYPQFAKYGKSDINFYFVNGELLKYKDGKRIRE